jgi:hypothetical protein
LAKGFLLQSTINGGKNLASVWGLTKVLKMDGGTIIGKVLGQPKIVRRHTVQQGEGGTSQQEQRPDHTLPSSKRLHSEMHMAGCSAGSSAPVLVCQEDIKKSLGTCLENFKRPLGPPHSKRDVEY